MPPSVHSDAHKLLVDLLVEARKSAGLLQEDLAARLQRSQSFVSNIERGERRVDVLDFHDLALAMGIDPAKLYEKYVKRLALLDQPKANLK